MVCGEAVQPAVSLMGRRLPLDGKRERHVDASQAQVSLSVARLDAAIRYADTPSAPCRSSKQQRHRPPTQSLLRISLMLGISCNALLVFVPVWGRSVRWIRLLSAGASAPLASNREDLQRILFCVRAAARHTGPCEQVSKDQAGPSSQATTTPMTR